MSVQKPTRPEPLDVKPDGIPNTLTDRDTWVCWRYDWDEDREEWTKVPVDVTTEGYAKSTDPDTWTSFENALAYHERTGTDTDGLGFVLHDEDTVLGLDLDDCRDPETSEREAWTDHVIENVPTYAEVSPSGTGVRLLGLGFLPDGGNRADIEDEPGHVEMYDTGRYLTVTGHRIDGAPEDVSQVHQAVKDVHGAYIATDDEPTAGEGGTGGVNPTPSGDRTGSVSLSDADLLEKAQNAENGDQFTRLWNGNTSGYPSHSEADQALVNYLAFWTGGDRQRIDSLFRDSGLMREKWDRDDYRKRTIDTALEGRTEFYDPDTPRGRDAGEDATSRGETPSTDDWVLSPSGVMTAAFTDPYGRLQQSDNPEDDPTIHDLRNNEAATYVWDVMEETGHDDVIAVVSGKDSDEQESGELRAFHNGIWTRSGEQQLREYGRQAMQVAYSSRVLEQLKEETRARKESLVPRSELGAPDGTIAVKNGLLNLRERDAPQLVDLKREHRAIRRLNVAYDPDADPPERWQEFLEESIRDDEDRRKFQEYAGYALWHHDQPYGKALFLLGPTDSGKGTALKTLQAILGEENVGTETLYDLMQTRWGPAGIYGKAVNIRNEVTPGGLKNVERFKELTGGGDRITAEYKGQDKFEFTVTQKFLFATNEVPSIESADEAFYNRCLFVKFPETVPEHEQDPDLLDKLLEEKPGILNWMLEGLRRLLERGHFTGERDTGGKKELCDAFGGVVDRFVHNCLEVTSESNHVAHKGDVYDLAQAYADDIDKDPEWNQQSGFTRSLKETAGIDDGQTKKLTGSNTKVFTGVKPRRDALEALDADVSWTDTTDTTQGRLDA